MLKTIALVALLGLASTAHADTTPTQTWNVTTGCNPEFNNGACFDPAQMSAVMTTTMETGTFFDTEGDFSFTGTVPVVTSIVGTFDGFAMTLVPNGTGDWLNFSYPEDVEFSANGSIYDIWHDGDFFMQKDTPFNTEVVGWSAVDPISIPEPGEWILTLLGCDLLLVWAKLRMRRRNG